MGAGVGFFGAGVAAGAFVVELNAVSWKVGCGAT